jgi:hypothetical protein
MKVTYGGTVTCVQNILEKSIGILQIFCDAMETREYLFLCGKKHM